MNSPRSCIGHGGWEHLETCPHTQHDTKAAAVLATHLRQGDLLLADRAFCSYELIVRSLAQGAHILMRLHQARARSLDWRKGKRLSSHERLVTCHRPQQPRGSSLTREEWNALPATLELRLIKLGYENRAGQKGEQTRLAPQLQRRARSGGSQSRKLPSPRRPAAQTRRGIRQSDRNLCDQTN